MGPYLATAALVSVLVTHSWTAVRMVVSSNDIGGGDDAAEFCCCCCCSDRESCCADCCASFDRTEAFAGGLTRARTASRCPVQESRSSRLRLVHRFRRAIIMLQCSAFKEQNALANELNIPCLLSPKLPNPVPINEDCY